MSEKYYAIDSMPHDAQDNSLWYRQRKRELEGNEPQLYAGPDVHKDLLAQSELGLHAGGDEVHRSYVEHGVPRKRHQTSKRSAEMVDIERLKSKDEFENNQKHYDMVYKIWKAKLLSSYVHSSSAPLAAEAIGNEDST